MTTLEFVLTLAILIITAISIVAIVYYEQKKSCTHKWKIIDELSIYENKDSKRPYCIRYILQCEKCGDIKINETKI